MLYLIPAFAIGWIFSIYVGYWKGALKAEDTEKSIILRAEGWAYFVGGLIFYSFLMIYMLTIHFEIELFGAFLRSFLLTIIAIASVIIVSRKVGLSIIRIFYESPEKEATYTLLSFYKSHKISIRAVSLIVPVTVIVELTKRNLLTSYPYFSLLVVSILFSALLFKHSRELSHKIVNTLVKIANTWKKLQQWF